MRGKRPRDYAKAVDMAGDASKKAAILAEAPLEWRPLIRTHVKLFRDFAERRKVARTARNKRLRYEISKNGRKIHGNTDGRG